MIRPQPLTKDDLQGLRRLLGNPLEAVSYRYLPDSAGGEYSGGGQGYDDELAAVVLTFAESDPVTITWAMASESEGLAIMDGVGGRAPVAQAADRQGWKPHHGRVITSISGAWHRTGDHSAESLWSLRLGFSRSSVVIALGVADPNPSYMPDEIIVLFDPLLAKRYRPHHSAESSWGSSLTLY